MRSAATWLVLMLTGACQRDEFAAMTTDTADMGAPDPRCGDGEWNDEEPCLRSLAAELPYAYEFIRHADFDGDGLGEFLAWNQWVQVSWALFYTGGVEVGDMPFRTLFEFKWHEIYRPEIIDFDGDGRTDLVGVTDFYYPSGDILASQRELGVWRNQGGYQFKQARYTVSLLLGPALASGDIDGDGRTDLFAVTSPDKGFIWAYASETDDIEYISTIDLQALQPVGEPQVVAADHNGDAHADFVLMDGSGRAWWLVGGPAHQLTPLALAAPAALAPESQTLLAGDLDDDGLVDLVAARLVRIDEDRSVTTVSLARGRSDGSFAAHASFDAEHPITSVGKEPFDDVPRLTHLGLFDLDGSGQLALVYAHADRPELVIHPRVAETRGAEPEVVPLDFPANSVFVADFEGDGEDAIYVTIKNDIEVEPSTDHPSGVIQKHYLVRFSPDP